jgi:hypothetical protein
MTQSKEHQQSRGSFLKTQSLKQRTSNSSFSSSIFSTEIQFKYHSIHHLLSSSSMQASCCILPFIAIIESPPFARRTQIQFLFSSTPLIQPSSASSPSLPAAAIALASKKRAIAEDIVVDFALRILDSKQQPISRHSPKSVHVLITFRYPLHHGRRC